MKDIQYYEQPLKIREGASIDRDCRMVILIGGLGENKQYMDDAVSAVVNGQGYNEFIEIHLDNPWVRVIIFGINSLDYTKFQNIEGLKEYLDGR